MNQKVNVLFAVHVVSIAPNGDVVNPAVKWLNHPIFSRVIMLVLTYYTVANLAATDL